MQSTGQTDEVQLPMADDSAAPGYRSVSSLAVVSLIVGIAAPLCLLAPLLSIVPLFGAALAILALRRIELSDGLMIGRRAALVGLVLCIGSVCAASTRTLTIRYLRTRQAAAVGTKWIQLLLAGETQQAFDLTTASLQLPAPREERQASEPDPTSQFVSTAPVPALVQFGGPASVRFDRNLSYTAEDHGQCVVEQRYVVTPTDGQADRRPLALRLKLQLGQARGEAQWQWLVVSGARDDPSAGESAG